MRRVQAVLSSWWPAGGRLAAVLAASWIPPAHAQQAPEVPAGSRLDAIEVTSSRSSLSVQEVPDSVTVVSGEELRDRGATDLRSALALVAGVSVYPGGDAGPAGATPSLLGRLEADDFLLLVDGVPVGGAFIPAFGTLDLHNVERIEVVRGSAPVFYGTTAFAGTIHVIHYPAGRSEGEAHVSAGSYGSMAADLSAVIAGQGPVLQSLGVDASRLRVAGSDVGADRVHALYRLATDTGLGRLHVDLDGTAQWQKPQSPVPTDPNGRPTALLPTDFNQNPADGHLDTDVARLVAGLDGSAGSTRWGTTLALTRTWHRAVEGFFDGFADTTGDGFRQSRQINEAFLDLHATQALDSGLDVTVGLNELLGRAQQASETFNYTIPLDGNVSAVGADIPATSSVSLLAHRTLFGVYLQSRWKPIETVNVLAGLRYNLATQYQKAYDGTQTFEQSDRRNRASGSLGASWKIWRDESGDLDDVLLHAAFSNTFQPAQIDFGPDSGSAPLLKPEAQRNITVGIKVDGLDGRFDADLDAFLTDFDHQPLNGSINGLPALVAAGGTRYRGVELEASFLVARSLRLNANASLDDARFRDFNDAVEGQLAGNRISLVPRWRASFGATFAPKTGPQFSINLNAEGSRYLDDTNLVSSGALATVDALIGYRWSDLQVRLTGTNLANRLEPVTGSELGDGQLYFLLRRRVELTLTRRL